MVFFIVSASLVVKGEQSTDKLISINLHQNDSNEPLLTYKWKIRKEKDFRVVIIIIIIIIIIMKVTMRIE